MDEKNCTLCGLTKPFTEFSSQKRGKFGLRSRCKACDAELHKKWRVGHEKRLTEASRKWRESHPDRVAVYEHRAGLKKHGFTVEQYAELLDSHGGVCAICGGVNSDGNRLGLDHDHNCCPGNYSCGSCVRGLLCKHCNYGIGHFRDSPKLLAAALNYLEASTVTQ